MQKSFSKKFLFTQLLETFYYKFNTALAGFFNPEYMTKLQIFTSGAVFASVITSSGSRSASNGEVSSRPKVKDYF